MALRKPVSHKADNVATLAKEIVLKFVGCEFLDLFSSEAHDLAASSVANELHVDKVECDMRQGDKAGASTVGEPVRAAKKVRMLIVCILLV